MAKLVDVASIASYFESLDDPRHTRNRKHLLVDIAVIAVCAILCGCDGPTAIHRWAKHRHSWLAQHLALPNGIPSRDCIRRTLIVLKPEAFQRGFLAWIGDTITAEAESSCRSARRHRRQVLSRLARPGQGLGCVAHRQCLGHRAGDRPGPGGHRGQVQRDHGHSAAPGADRLEGGPDHDRCDGLPEGDRPAGRHRGRRLCDRREGQPAEARRGDPDVLHRSPGGRPEEVQAPVSRDARGRSTAASTSGRTIWRRCPGTSPAARTGPGSRRSAARSG